MTSELAKTMVRRALAAPDIRAAQRQGGLSMLAAILLFVGLHQAYDVQDFPFDAALYWKLSSPSTLLDFPKTIRGYFWPALLSPARYLANAGPGTSYLPFRIFTSVAYGFGLTIVLPSFYVHAFGGRLTFGRRLVVPLLVAVLFPGIIVYPLSDLPAFLLLIGSIVLILASFRWSRRLRGFACLFVAGILLAGSYNTRTIYLFPLACIVFATPCLAPGPAGMRLAAVISLTAGMFLASLPQALINLRHHGAFTPTVFSQVSHSKSLFASQLLWGITVQRYETSIDKSAAAPCVNYMDRAGQDLLDRAKIDTKNFGLRDYLRLVAAHPLNFLGIYGRHLLNGIDLRDGEAYLTQPSSTRGALSAASLSTLLLAAWLLLVRDRTGPDPARPMSASSDRQATRSGIAARSRIAPFWFFVIMLPVLAILPGATETRFFLPLHLFVYSTIAFTWDWGALKRSFLLRPMLICCMVAATCAVYFAVTLTTMSGIRQVCADLSQ